MTTRPPDWAPQARSEPDWVENTRRMVRDRRAIKGRDKSGTALNILLHPNLSVLLSKAASRRGMNRSAYTRRALAIHIAHDLDAPLAGILALCPKPVPFTGRSMLGNDHATLANPPMDDGADLVGPDTWCPHPGCSGTHFTSTLWQEQV